jgi:nicotinate-nucleotide adenylyltransferase
MKIGVLGGSFDPVHNGHLEIANLALAELKLDKVVFVPVNLPWEQKTHKLIGINDRVNMLKLALEKKKKFEISMVDIVRGGPTYSIDTILDLERKLRPKEPFYFIIGYDNIKDIWKWKDVGNFMEKTYLVVASRNQKENVNGPNKMFKINNKLGHISSSLIRKKIQENKEISNLVPREIETYIKRKKLYKIWKI